VVTVDDVELTDSIGLALPTVPDSLKPGERLAFVLHELFAVLSDEIGRILDRSTAAKMPPSRARRKVQVSKRPTADAHEQREAVQAFLAEARHSDTIDATMASIGTLVVPHSKHRQPQAEGNPYGAA